MAIFRFIPQEAKFFDLFEQGARNLLAAANALLDMVENYEMVEAKARAITELEHKGDTITHQIIGQLHRTFVTPLEREDIALLTNSLDDMLDFLEAAADMMLVYKIDKPTPRAVELSRIIVQTAEEVNTSIPMLRQRSQLKYIHDHCVEINRLENDADRILRLALAELFESTDVANMIKWREIYQLLESATDRGEDIANVLEGVVLKHA